MNQEESVALASLTHHNMAIDDRLFPCNMSDVLQWKYCPYIMQEIREAKCKQGTKLYNTQAQNVKFEDKDAVPLVRFKMFIGMVCDM